MEYTLLVFWKDLASRDPSNRFDDGTRDETIKFTAPSHRQARRSAESRITGHREDIFYWSLYGTTQHVASSLGKIRER